MLEPQLKDICAAYATASADFTHLNIHLPVDSFVALYISIFGHPCDNRSPLPRAFGYVDDSGIDVTVFCTPSGAPPEIRCVTP